MSHVKKVLRSSQDLYWVLSNPIRLHAAAAQAWQQRMVMCTIHRHSSISKRSSLRIEPCPWIVYVHRHPLLQCLSSSSSVSPRPERHQQLLRTQYPRSDSYSEQHLTRLRFKSWLDLFLLYVTGLIWMDIIDIKLKEAEMSQFLDVHSKS